jgi:hypothetical protein
MPSALANRFIHLDLAEDPHEPLQRHRFGARAGRLALTEELAAMRDSGVQHIGLHFRRNRRPLDETMAEIASDVLPAFHPKTNAQTRAA